jgi:apolipoprotein D and lipocalin family protein
MKKLITLILSLLTGGAFSQQLQTVPFVDLNKYMGKWYEIGSFPQRFQQGCNCTTAEYTMTKDMSLWKIVATEAARVELNLTLKAKHLLQKTVAMQN